MQVGFLDPVSGFCWVSVVQAEKDKAPGDDGEREVLRCFTTFWEEDAQGNHRARHCALTALSKYKVRREGQERERSPFSELRGISVVS